MLWFRPKVVIATGGFVSVPAVLAAALLRRRDLPPGAERAARRREPVPRAVRGPSRAHVRAHAARVPGGRRGVHVGYPVRSKIETATRRGRARALRHPGRAEGRVRRRREHGIALDQPRHRRGAQDGAARPTGSPSSTRPASPRRRTTTRSTTPASGCASSDSSPDIPGRYACRRFIDDIQDVYALADLVVARSGAGTIMELGAIGKPSLLIPKSDAPGGHQLQNAIAFADAGAAEIFYEEPSVRGRPHDQPGLRRPARAEADRAPRSTRSRCSRWAARRTGWCSRTRSRRNVDEIDALADGKPLLNAHEGPGVHPGVLLDQRGGAIELRFQSNLVSTGALADVRLERSPNGTRATIRERREAGRRASSSSFRARAASR